MSYLTKMFDNLAKANNKKAVSMAVIENEKFLRKNGLDHLIPAYAELPKPAPKPDLPKQTEDQYRDEVKSYAPITLTF